MAARLSVFSLLAAIAVAGCSSGGGNPPAGPGFNEAAIVGAADWSKAETETIVLSNYSFTPNDLVFRHDQAYRLHLKNGSTHTHTFSSDTFFGAVAIQKVEVAGSEVSRNGLVTIQLDPGKEADVFFVAKTPGAYTFYCNVFMHDMMGMNGKIAIQ